MRKALAFVLVVSGLWGMSLGWSAAQTPPEATVGDWAAPSPWPDLPIHLNLLPNGKVFFWGGGDGQSGEKTWVWDPDTGLTTQIMNLTTEVFCSGHALLPDGRLLVTGGHIADNTGLTHTTIYDFNLQTWTRVDNMNAARWYPTNAALANGEQLVAGGDISPGNVNRIPQVWKTTGGWRDLTGAARSLPLYPWLHLAPDGRIFNSGYNRKTQFLDTNATSTGRGGSGAGKWDAGPNSKFGPRSYGSSVMYEPGKVIIIGGGYAPTKTTETIDLTAPSPAWQYSASMGYARRHLNATLLPDGKILVTGGTSGTGFNNATGAAFAAELWDPATQTWSTMASAQNRRLYHSTSLLLPDGRVISAGGGRPAAEGETDQKNYELFSPPYLFKGPRPVVTTAPTSAGYGQSFFVGTPDAAAITRVTMIRLPSVTHAFDMNQRFNGLAFSQAPGGLNVTTPASSNLAPPGHYMLFILNGDGVPSVAKIVAIQ